MDKSALRELLQFALIALPLWGVWFSLRHWLRRIENTLGGRIERLEHSVGHRLIRLESAVCLEAGKTRRHTADMFMPKTTEEAQPVKETQPVKEPQKFKAFS